MTSYNFKKNHVLVFCHHKHHDHVKIKNGNKLNSKVIFVTLFCNPLHQINSYLLNISFSINHFFIFCMIKNIYSWKVLSWHTL
jgi:hypothetical protein